MSEFGWVNPANATDISLVDFPPPAVNRGPINLVTGNTVYLPKIAAVSLDEAPKPQWDLYNLVRATEQPPGGRPPEYYDSSLTYAFRNAANTGPGVVGDATSIVQETRIYTEIPIADLYLRKSQELTGYNAFVRVQSVRSTAPGSENFWIQLQEDDRERQLNATKVLFDRLKDRTLGDDSSVVPPSVKSATSYWARDPRVVLIRDSNGNRIFAPVDEVSWGHVVKDSGLYDEGRQIAAINVQNAIEAELAADDWPALADIDVEDRAAYGWPLYYEGPVSPTIKPV